MPVPANVIRANIRATMGTNEEIVHTLHFRRVNTSVTGEPTLQEIADKIRDEWVDMLNFVSSVANTVKQHLVNTLVYKTVDVYALDAAGHATTQAQSVFAAGVGGTNTGTPLPPEVALVASLRTGLPGRSKRGRLYMGGWAASTLAAGGVALATVNKTLAEALADFGGAMKFPVPVGTDRLNWSVLSRTLTETNKITEVRVGTLYDVQRRRQSAMVESFSSSSISY